MRIIMGGPGSSGSTLLRTVLNRHPAVFSGPELNFFNKEQLFEDWNRFKSKTIGRHFPRLATLGWFCYPGTGLLHPDYGWQAVELKSLLRASSSIGQFVDAYFARPLQAHAAKLWIEKTPSNAYSFKHFLETFADGKVIHTSRNPFDAAASLVRRGYTPAFAAASWIYNSATAMQGEHSERYYLVRYEDLVTSPQKQLADLLRFVGVEFDPNVLLPHQEESSTAEKIASWGLSPGERISSPSLGGFGRLEPSTRRELLAALSLIRVSDRHVQRRGLKYCTCAQLCERLGYEFHPEVHQECLPKIRADLRREWLGRSLRLYPTGWNNFPVELAQ